MLCSSSACAVAVVAGVPARCLMVELVFSWLGDACLADLLIEFMACMNHIFHTENEIICHDVTLNVHDCFGIFIIKKYAVFFHRIRAFC